MRLHLPGGPRVQKALRIAGFVVFGFLAFVFALQLTFPYHRVKDQVEHALADKYDVSIGGVERGIIPGRMYLTSVRLVTRPSPADQARVDAIADKEEREKQQAQIVSSLFIKRLEVDVGFLPLLRGVIAVKLDAEVGSGRIHGKIQLAKGGLFALFKPGPLTRVVVDLSGENLPAVSLPMREALGLPMTGKLGFDVELDLPSEKAKTGKVATNWEKATGEIAFTCGAGCGFGPGKLKTKVKNARSQAFMGDGVDIGHIEVDSLVARIEIAKGMMEIKKWDAKSADGELYIDLAITLAPTFGESSVDGCLRFAGSEVLRKREPNTHTALTTTGADRNPQDNLFHIKLSGKFKELLRQRAYCGPDVAKLADDSAGGAPRPNLTVQPDDPVHKPATTFSPPPPPPPAEPPPPEPPADAPVQVPVPHRDTVDEFGRAGLNGNGNGNEPPPPPEDGSPPPVEEPQVH